MPRHKFSDSSFKLRTTAQLNSALEKKLLGYAAVAGATGVGILSLAKPSEARIVYTSTHQTLLHHSSLNIDLNSDGINDFTLFARSSDVNIVNTQGTRSSAVMLVFPVATANQVWGNGRYPSALAAGVRLSSKGQFAASRFLMGGVYQFSGNPTSYFGPWAPAGGSIKNRYLGLKFVINGQVHYGWARLNVELRPAEQTGVRAVLTGYAYETVVNKPILTGKTTGPDVASPQPATLGQLSLGAAGLVAWRRQEEAVDSPASSRDPQSSPAFDQ